mmetsp:Transcript_14993/g.33487  ORF Transcript_14993/g.33487 Transcript_14993/m.33487 type:complete len:104 (-) Transcript_14993:609-920(-)
MALQRPTTTCVATSFATMVRSRAKRPGMGAVASCHVRFLHPSAPFRERYGDQAYNRQELGGFVVIASSTERISRKVTFALKLRHDEFPDQTFTGARTKIRITE